MNKIISLAILIALGIGFNGCTIKYPTLKERQSPGYNIIYKPKLNTISKAEIGENIYSKSNLFTSYVYNITLKESAFGKSTYASINYDINKNPTLSSNLLTWNTPYTNTLCGIGKAWQVCLTDKNDTGSFTHIGNYMYGEYAKLTKPAKYEIKPSEKIKITEDSFKYEVIYQGKQDNKIKVTFREFYAKYSQQERELIFLIRDAFTQTINYTLDKNGTAIIGFKGLRIEVLKATNMEITYKVVKDYN